MGTHQISAAFQGDREGKALNATLQIVFVRERQQGKTAPKHVFLSNMPRQLGNRRYTSWIQPKKWSAASMNPAEERAR